MITNALILLATLIILGCLAFRERRKTVGKLYWHIHHDQLLEMATEPIARRRRFIRVVKLSGEVKTRLRCLKPVKGTLPSEVVGAFRFHANIMEYRDKIWKLHLSMGINHRRPVSCWLCARLCELCDEVDENLRETLQKHESEINRLHDEECCCDWDGTTLFPGG